MTVREPYTAAPLRLPFKLTLGAILAFSFILRFAARAASGAEAFWTNGYLFFFDLAHSLASGQGYSIDGVHATAFRVPFYSIFIAAVTQGRHEFWALLIAQALISTGTVACAAALGWQFFGRTSALTAAFLTAIYPYYVGHDTALQETGLFTFLTALATVLLFATQRSRSFVLAALTGLVLGLAILTRSTVLPFALFAIGWLIVPEQSLRPIGKRLSTAAIGLGVMGATLSPWLVRNHGLTARWTLGTEVGALVYYANNPHTFDFYPRQSIDLSAGAARQALTPADRAVLHALENDEAATSDWFQRRGMAYILGDPGNFLIAAARKNLAAFGVLPSPRVDWRSSVIRSSSYGILLFFALIAVWNNRRRWREFLPIHAHFVLFAAITGVLWGHSSHRTFLDVYLIVLAADALVSLRPKVGTVWGRIATPRPGTPHAGVI